MITLYAFGRVHPGMACEGRDMRVQWALEETGLPYRVHALDYVGGEFDGPEYSRLSTFHQVPVIDDEGFVVAESAAIVLYLAEKAGKLMPLDLPGRTEVVQWCFATIATLERPLFEMTMVGIGVRGAGACGGLESLRKEAHRWLGGLERRLTGREWIACDMFTVADILLASVLRAERDTDLLDPYPHLQAYRARCLAQPAWQRTLRLCAQRQGVNVLDATR